MFTVRIRRGASPGCLPASATARTFRDALGFIEEFCACEHGVLAFDQVGPNDRRVMKVYDWVDFVSPDPKAVAEIIVPPDLGP
jgi:hypothetical protein